jgi:hypothetical protein
LERKPMIGVEKPEKLRGHLNIVNGEIKKKY